MFSFRGDGHKLYLKLKRNHNKQQSINELEEIAELVEMEQFYRELKREDLEKIRLGMIKEQKGNGMIPLLVSSLPWLAFIFSRELRSLLNRSPHLLFSFLFLYTVLIIFGTLIHYREKAWAAVHVEMIDLILKEKTK